MGEDINTGICVGLYFEDVGEYVFKKETVTKYKHDTGAPYEYPNNHWDMVFNKDIPVFDIKSGDNLHLDLRQDDDKNLYDYLENKLTHKPILQIVSTWDKESNKYKKKFYLTFGDHFFGIVVMSTGYERVQELTETLTNLEEDIKTAKLLWWRLFKDVEPKLILFTKYSY